MSDLDLRAGAPGDLTPWLNSAAVGDSLELLREMPDACVDLVIASPHDRPAGMAADDAEQWQADCLAQMLRVVRDGGSVVYHLRWEIRDGLLDDRARLMRPFPVRQILIWVPRERGQQPTDGILPSYEPLYLMPTPSFRLAQGANGLGDVWHIPPDGDATLPVALLRRVIEAADAGTVLDPFMSRGQTALAAIAAGAAWAGFEDTEEARAKGAGRIERALAERRAHDGTNRQQKGNQNNAFYS